MSRKIVTGEGRTRQKERTRQALLRATRALFAEKIMPTIALAAARAGVSEATAYRYYSDVRSLMQDSVEEQWPGLEGVLAELRGMGGAEERAEHAARALARIVLAHEAQIRAVIALSYGSGQASRPVEAAKARPAFRLLLIDAVLEPLDGEITAGGRRLLRSALAIVIAAEAVLSVKDALNASDDEILEAMGWSAREITASALAQDGRRASGGEPGTR